MRKVLALLALIVSIFTLASCGSSHGVTENKAPVSLIGEWHQDNPNPDGWMTASISGGSIQVNLRGRDSSSIFWMGTFDTHKRSASKFKVVSLGDQDAMKYAIASASDKNGNPLKSMVFAYDHGVLSFEFSALGSSTTIHMTKTKSAHIPTATPKPQKSKKSSAPKVKSPKVSTRKK